MSLEGWIGVSVSIVLFVLGSIIIPIVIHIHKKRKSLMENKEPQKADAVEVSLKPKYTSLFVEDGKLKSEEITITKQQKNHKIEGIVTLTENIPNTQQKTYTYKLKGTFANKIITAEYFSTSQNTDERGSINIKLIDEDAFSGFCSFSKIATSEDEIRVSPYIWVAGEKVDLLNGTFNFCTDCHNNNYPCCCNNEKVDMPIFLSNELPAIRNAMPNTTKSKEKGKFSKDIAKSNLRQMKSLKADDKTDKCYFFDNTQNQCTIYTGRPIDCRLFPFDVRFSESRKEYMVGYYSDVCTKTLDNSQMKKWAHLLRPYFFLLYPYLNVFTSEALCPKLTTSESGWIEINTFKDFVF